MGLSNKIEKIQRDFLYSLSSYLGLRLSYSEARILYGIDLLASRRSEQCYAWVKKHLSMSDKGLITCLFEKRDNYSRQTKNNMYREPTYRSQRFYKNPLNFLTRIASEIAMKK